MEKFQEPKITVVNFSTEDILNASVGFIPGVDDGDIED